MIHKQQHWAWGLAAFFGISYFILSLLLQYHFRTSGWDMGIFQQTLYQYAHGILGPNTVRNVPTLLGDHFELLLFLISPLWWILREYTLFFVQAAAVSIGGMGVYAVIRHTRPEAPRWIALGAMTLFFIHWSLVQAMTFDFHNNVLGAMLLPWLILCLIQSRWKSLWILAVLFLMSKETASLTLLFLGIGMLIFGPVKARVHGVGLAILSLLWYFTTVRWLIPLFGSGSYAHWSYEALGSNTTEALFTILRHPLNVIALLFNAPEKHVFWLYSLGTGGMFLFRWPRLLLLALPLVAMKLFSSEPNHWGIWYHYQVELAIFVALASGWTALLLKTRTAKVLLISLLLINGMASFTMTMNDRVTPLYRLGYELLRPRDPWKNAAVEAIAQIPQYAAVSTNNLLAPHLTQRAQLTLFPQIDGAEYVLLHRDTTNVWPLGTREDMERAQQDFLDTTNTIPLYAKDGIELYRITTQQP